MPPVKCSESRPACEGQPKRENKSVLGASTHPIHDGHGNTEIKQTRITEIQKINTI